MVRYCECSAYAYASNEMIKKSGYSGRGQKHEKLSSKVTPVAFDPCATLFTITSRAHGESRPPRLTRTSGLQCWTLKSWR